MTCARTADAEDVFDTPLEVRWDTKRHDWVLLQDLIWRGTDGDAVIVPAGERTDFASVPRLLQWLMPATGKWTRAAVVHDMLCRLLAIYWVAVGFYERELAAWCERDDVSPVPKPPTPPRFNAVDTDAVFEKIMRQDGVGPIMRRIGWVGVRWGAAGNPARRAGWAGTAWRVLRLSTVFLAATLAVGAGIAWAVPW